METRKHISNDKKSVKKMKSILMIAMIVASSYSLFASMRDADDENIRVEEWMTAPFETEIAEEPIALETWMTAPFETEIAEEPIALESWMTAPFETEIAEEPIALESWMTSPFETETSEVLVESETELNNLNEGNGTETDPEIESCESAPSM